MVTVKNTSDIRLCYRKRVCIGWQYRGYKWAEHGPTSCSHIDLSVWAKIVRCHYLITPRHWQVYGNNKESWIQSSKDRIRIKPATNEVAYPHDTATIWNGEFAENTSLSDPYKRSNMKIEIWSSSLSEYRVRKTYSSFCHVRCSAFVSLGQDAGQTNQG